MERTCVTTVVGAFTECVLAVSSAVSVSHNFAHDCGVTLKFRTTSPFSDTVLQWDFTVPTETRLFLGCGAVVWNAAFMRFLSGFSPSKVHLCPVLSGCPVQVERRGLEAHLSECNFRRECPKGCGRMLPSPNQSQHNCVAELRIEVEVLRYALTLTTGRWALSLRMNSEPRATLLAGQR